MATKAIIAGASGLIGSNLLQILLNNNGYDEVVLLVRKKLTIDHQKLKQVVVDFDRLSDYPEWITGHALFCCLGTTKAKTPDVHAYRKIDHDYPVQLAEMARHNGIAQYHFVSAAGANANSSIFYSRLKGETENDLVKTGLFGLYIYRPSLLFGGRKESRTGERIAIAIFRLINPLLMGSFRKYRSISAATVALTMYKQSLIKKQGVFIYASDQIQALST